METLSLKSRSYDPEACCVRTIVVWKLKYCLIISLVKRRLRENHSGMETYELVHLLEYDLYLVA